MTDPTAATLTSSGESDHCATQARREQHAADTTLLDNVRIKHQLAADTWTSLGRRAAAHETMRNTKQPTAYLLRALHEQNENPDRIER